MKKDILWKVGGAVVLVAITAYVVLDTFVLKKELKKDEGMNTAIFESSGTADVSDNSQNSDSSNAVISDTSYKNDNIEISLSEYDEYGNKLYVADVKLSSAQYLKTAFAKDTFGQNIKAKTSETAYEHDAVFAVNGDYYGARETGYVIRNGNLYRDTAGEKEIACIYADGHLDIVNPDEKSAQDLIDDGVWQAWSFGPALIKDSKIVPENKESDVRNPRTAIGMVDNCHYIFIVADGRTTESEGLTVYELAEFMQKMNVSVAYNLDGGGSSSMYFNGTVVNKPTSSGSKIREREVSDIVYVN